jgi:hypothetical protein
MSAPLAQDARPSCSVAMNPHLHTVARVPQSDKAEATGAGPAGLPTASNKQSDTVRGQVRREGARKVLHSTVNGDVVAYRPHAVAAVRCLARSGRDFSDRHLIPRRFAHRRDVSGACFALSSLACASERVPETAGGGDAGGA